jgi:hypothetical protein
MTAGWVRGVHAGAEFALKLGHLSEETLGGHGAAPCELNAYILKVIEENNDLNMEGVREGER